MIQNIPGRRRVSLNGRWRSVVDPYEAGYRSFTGEPWNLGWFRNFPVRPGIAEVDFDTADLLDVPGDWNSQAERLFFYEGTVWYQRRFRAPSRPDARWFLHFGAANYHALVYLNGERIGEHEGGFTPFCFEVTAALREGENFVTVKVDNTRRRKAVPTVSTDWWNYGGLTRDVSLVEVPSTFVREYALFLDRRNPHRIRGFVQLDGSDLRQEILVRIPESGLETRMATDSAGRASVDLPVPVDVPFPLWAPWRPVRHTVVIESETDRIVEEIGFRTVSTRGHQILVNGQPVFLRGISLHEEAPARPGRAFGEADARTLLGWAQELGCNFVRLAHYPHDEAMVRVAEELGLLVWAEIPVYWHIAWEEADTLACAKRQLAELIARDRNRAAVILWSVANEAPPSEARLRFLAALARHARELDGTRLVTAALMARLRPPEREGEQTTMVLDDPIGLHLDVMGCNEYLGWYYGELDEVPRVRWETAWEKPLIVSEFGAGALEGRHGGPETIFSEEHQAAVYEAQIAMLRRIPFLAGLSPWILKDFRSPRRVLKGIQDYYNRKGLISDRGKRKRAFSVLQTFYRELAEHETEEP